MRPLAKILKKEIRKQTKERKQHFFKTTKTEKNKESDFDLNDLLWLLL